MLGRFVDLVCGRFLLWPFGVSVFLFVLLLTSLPLDDRDVWLPVVFSPLGLQVCSLRSVCGSLAPGRGVSLVARGPLLCPATPRESAMRVLVLRCVLTGLFLFWVIFACSVTSNFFRS